VYVIHKKKIQKVASAILYLFGGNIFVKNN
jgi:hypothetical protein